MKETWRKEKLRTAKTQLNGLKRFNSIMATTIGKSQMLQEAPTDWNNSNDGSFHLEPINTQSPLLPLELVIHLPDAT